MTDVFLPGRQDRLTLLGMTGQGKSVAEIWHLSQKDFSRETWLLVDYKGEDHVSALLDVGARETGVEDKIPSKPGLYVVRPGLRYRGAMETLWLNLHEKRNVGVAVDEGYLVQESEVYDALLTQGRSLYIPMIVVSQRPRWVTRFVFSEATMFQVYGLNDDEDWRRIAGFVPLPSAWDSSRQTLPYGVNLAMLLNPPNYYSYYFDTTTKKLVKFSPVPPVEESIDAIARQLRATRRIKVI